MHINLLSDTHFRVDRGCENRAYKTNDDGLGLWVLIDTLFTYEWRQIAGTYQFSLNQKTDSGKRKAIKRYFEKHGIQE